MISCLVFSTSTAELILKNKSFKKKYLYITDKVNIYNFLKKNKYNSLLLEAYINTKEKNKIFFNYYNFINSKIKKLGQKKLFEIDNLKINSLFVNFRGIGPRIFVGIKLLFLSLKRIQKKTKITQLYYFYDLNNKHFDSFFYSEILNNYCFKKNIKFINYKFKNDDSHFFKSIKKKIIRLNYFFKEINIDKLRIIFKLCLTYFFFFLKKENYFIYPLKDIIFSNYNVFKTKFLKFENIKYLDKKFNFLNFKRLSIEVFFFKYILEKNEEINNFTKKYILNFNKKNKNFKKKKLFFSLHPQFKLRTFIFYLKKKNEIYFLQHGGKQLISKNREIINNDMDYFLSKKFYAYGISNTFKKFNKTINTTLYDLGCLKTSYQKKVFNNNSLKDYIFYVPTGLNFFLFPTNEILASEKYKDQLKICNLLNSEKSFKPIIKAPIDLGYNHEKDDQHECNPILASIKKYSNLKVVSSSLIKEINLYNPKIIITDSYSTAFYECLHSNSEIIVYSDKYLKLELDVYSLVNKRVFIVNSIKKLYFVINQIKLKKKSKIQNNEFYDKFYKLKKDMF